MGLRVCTRAIARGHRLALGTAGWLVLAAGAAHAADDDPRLCSELQPLRPLLGQWVAKGIFGQDQGGMRLRYAPALDGQVVKAWSYIRTPDAAESLLYETVIRWHPGQEQIVFRTHSTKGALYEGVMEIDGRTFKSRFEDFRPGADAVQQWRQTVELAEDGQSYAWEVFGQADGEWKSAAAHTFERANRVAAKEAAMRASDELVKTTIHAEPERQLEFDAVIPAKRSEVWHAWTTNEGVTSFLCPDANVELKVGGAYEIYFVPDAPVGQRGSETCRVLAYVPEEMVAFSWNAPPSIPTVRNGEHKAHVVIRLTDADGGGTHVNVRHLGFGTGEDWDKTFAYFRAAWPKVLAWLHASCDDAAPKSAKGEKQRAREDS